MMKVPMDVFILDLYLLGLILTAKKWKDRRLRYCGLIKQLNSDLVMSYRFKYLAIPGILVDKMPFYLTLALNSLSCSAAVMMIACSHVWLLVV